MATLMLDGVPIADVSPYCAKLLTALAQASQHPGVLLEPIETQTGLRSERDIRSPGEREITEKEHRQDYDVSIRLRFSTMRTLTVRSGGR